MLNRTRRHWDTRRYGTGSGERPEHRSIGLLIYAQVAPRSPYRTNLAWFDLARYPTRVGLNALSTLPYGLINFLVFACQVVSFITHLCNLSNSKIDELRCGKVQLTADLGRSTIRPPCSSSSCQPEVFERFACSRQVGKFHFRVLAREYYARCSRGQSRLYCGPDV